MAIVLRLYQAGTPLGDAVDVVVTAASEVVDLPWDGTLAASGSSIAVDVAAAGTNGDDAELQTVEWRPDVVASATPADSGWLPLATAPVVLDLHALRQAPHLRQTATHPWLDEGGQLQQPTHQHWRLDLRDPTNPAGYLEVGKLAGGGSGCGPAPSKTRAKSSSYSSRSPSGGGCWWLLGRRSSWGWRGGWGSRVQDDLFSLNLSSRASARALASSTLFH